MTKFRMWKKIAFLLLLFNTFVFPLEIEIFQLYKSSQWKHLIDVLKKKNPNTLEQYYLYAKALEKEKKEENYLEIIQYYLFMTGIQCKKKSA